MKTITELPNYRITELMKKKVSPLACPPWRERGRGVLPAGAKLLCVAWLFALCTMPFAAYAQMFNSITNDGTMAGKWYVGDVGNGKVGIGIDTDVDLNNNLDLADGFSIGSHTFTPGWQVGTGWVVNYDDSTGASLTIDNVNVRGSLSAYELLLSQIKINDGNAFISSGGKVDTVNFTGPKVYFTTEDVSGHGISPFMAGDMIMSQTANSSAITFDGNGDINNDTYLLKRWIFKVDSVVGLRIYYSNLTGTPAQRGWPKKGDVFTRFGNISNTARQGAIGLYATDQYAPYIRITDGVNSWAGWKDIDNIKFQAGRIVMNHPIFGPIDGYGTLINGDAWITANINMTNQSAINISGFNNDAGYVNHDNVGAQTYYSSSAPGSPATGDFWFDTSISGSYIMKRWNGSTWQPVGVYMDASGVYAGNITTGQITAGTVTGWVVQTAASGARIVLDGASNKIKFYNSGGTFDSEIYGSTGTVWDTQNDLSFGIGGSYFAETPTSSGHSINFTSHTINLNSTNLYWNSNQLATQSWVNSQTSSFITDGNQGWDDSYGFGSDISTLQGQVTTIINTYGDAIGDLDFRVSQLEACACP
jgi:hypothetical protein